MQLFIILALLLYGGKTQTQNLLQEVKPMLETFGGEELKEALKSAEEISQVLTAVRGFNNLNGKNQTRRKAIISMIVWGQMQKIPRFRSRWRLFPT